MSQSKRMSALATRIRRETERLILQTEQHVITGQLRIKESRSKLNTFQNELGKPGTAVAVLFLVYFDFGLQGFVFLRGCLLRRELSSTVR